MGSNRTLSPAITAWIIDLAILIIGKAAATMYIALEVLTGSFAGSLYIDVRMIPPIFYAAAIITFFAYLYLQLFYKRKAQIKPQDEPSNS
jgi:hypothetical protein